MRRGAEVIYQGASWTATGTASATFSCVSNGRRTSAPGATRRGIRSSRAARSRTSCSNSVLHGAARADPGRCARGDGDRTRHRRDRAPALPRLRRLLPRGAADFWPPSSEDEATYPYPVAHCGLCEYERDCERRWEDDDHLSWSPTSVAIRSSNSTTPASEHRRGARRLRPVMANRHRRAGAPTGCGTGRTSDRASVARASIATSCCHSTSERGSACCRSRRSATSSSTWKGTRTSNQDAASSTCSAS